MWASTRSGHEHAPLQVDHARALADQRAHAGVVADIDDAAAAHGQRLPHAVLCIDRVDDTIAVDQVRRAFGGGCAARKRKEHQGEDLHMPPMMA
ncbi:hypothetical protein [Massilia sp. Dwa41.01b]|uniref:hypothetical protein n=1 Tax=Massilia sp. Dwa41.01b TaxID=2709302 RepID=UPI001E60841B|nr:hypothetical protein [Massilia sp. Dwa41.01b]